MEKYWLTGTDFRSATFLVMDTGHFSYTGLRGVHAAVDCVAKWLIQLSARFTVHLHPHNENAKVKRIKRFCMHLQLLRHENTTLASP